MKQAHGNKMSNRNKINYKLTNTYLSSNVHKWHQKAHSSSQAMIDRLNWDVFYASTDIYTA